MNRNFKEFYMDYKRGIEKAYSKLFYSYTEIEGVKIYFRKSDFVLLNDVLNTIRMEQKDDAFNKYTVVRDYCKMLNENRIENGHKTLFSKSYGPGLNLVDGFFFNLEQKEIDNINFYDLKKSRLKVKTYNPYTTNYSFI